MANKGFKINKEGIRRMSREIEKEFAKNPVRVPLEANPGDAFPPAATVTNYHGPVVTITGDHAQLAWGNSGTVNQGQSTTDQIAPGYEQLATLLTNLLAQLPVLGLAADDDTDFRDTTEAVLAEVVREEPNQGVIRRSVAALKGYLAQIAAGTAQAATDEATEFARTAIEGLSDSLPF